MQMSNEEIRRNYREAKNKKLQIGILADLNCCDKETIEGILFGAEQPQKAVDLDAVIKSLFDEMESVEGQIGSLEERYTNLKAAIDALSKLGGTA